MKVFSKIINEETKELDCIVCGDVPLEGYSELEREQAYNGKFYLKGYAPSESEEEKHERIQSYSMTRSDFFDGFIIAFNLGQSELRTIVEQILNSINITDIQIKVALNNYDNALNFYRKHTLFTLLNNVEIPISEDMTLVFTSEIWDKFFDTKDYKELQKAIVVKPEPEPTEEPVEEVE